MHYLNIGSEVPKIGSDILVKLIFRRRNAFPTDELLALKCKKGVSVNRCKLLNDPNTVLS